jgi:low affinity Fe/Cu permease
MSITMSSNTSKMSVSERFARLATSWAGSSWALGTAVLLIFAWGLSGPIFGYSDTWQLVINTSTTIITFLMVFLIQRSQNNDSHAIHLKLDELLAAVQGASNRLIAAEDMSEADVRILKQHFQTIVDSSRGENSTTASHSVEETETQAEVRQRAGRHDSPET